MDFLISFKCNLLNFKATFCRGAGFDISCEISTYVSGYCASYVRMFYYAKLLYAMLHYVMLCYIMLCFFVCYFISCCAIYAFPKTMPEVLRKKTIDFLSL